MNAFFVYLFIYLFIYFLYIHLKNEIIKRIKETIERRKGTSVCSRSIFISIVSHNSSDVICIAHIASCNAMPVWTWHNLGQSKNSGNKLIDSKTNYKKPRLCSVLL